MKNWQVYKKLKEASSLVFSKNFNNAGSAARSPMFNKGAGARRAVSNNTQSHNPQTQYIDNGQMIDIPAFYQEFLKQLSPTSKSINQPKNFSKLEPAKLDELKQAPVQGVDEMIITYPEPTITENPLAWMAQLGGILTTAGNLIQTGFSLGANIGSFKGVPTGVTPPVLHTGGKVTGKDEILTILRGGETVRTEAQEQELQQEKMKELLSVFAPTVSGEDDHDNPYSQLMGQKKKKKEPNTPVLMNKTSHDEDFIIHTVAQAWKFNRGGFRNVLRYE